MWHPHVSGPLALFVLATPLLAQEPSPQPAPGADEERAEARPLAPAPTVQEQVAPPLLTRDEIQAAITLGMAAKGKVMGLVLTDVGRGIMNALAATKYNSSPLGSGFSIIVYTPTAWVEQQASDAAKEYRTIAPEDLSSEEFQAPILRIVIHPDTPGTLGGGNAGAKAVAAFSAQHVVLRDETKRIVIQPLGKEEYGEEVANGLGARQTYAGIRASFSLDEIGKVRGPSGDGEFFVTVVGGNEEKNFKIKGKHFEHLPGLRHTTAS
jgi:hypothetical protein